MQQEGEGNKPAMPTHTNNQLTPLWERLLWLAVECLSTKTVVERDGKIVGYTVQFRGHIAFVPAEEVVEEDANRKGNNS